jgi:hypothetical protein
MKGALLTQEGSLHNFKMRHYRCFYGRYSSYDPGRREDLWSHSLHINQCEINRLFHPTSIPLHRLQKASLGCMVPPFRSSFLLSGIIAAGHARQNSRKVEKESVNDGTLVVPQTLN